ncbi:hypothetical protein AUR04nite_13170 [Glutamicibacter uratoxydans]|uniref:Uncharacterized protein n=1 Tax=Glutamicibacter uratoxydans TaxID=43667 RepID=A0A4Y4DQB3_GLUUR|nr:hypothetical protein AUR04nite_13170 [Glutamicibacter uratoxydans]
MLTMIVAAAAPTSKLTAYCGRIGAISPKPRAMMNAATSSTRISWGIAGRAVRVGIVAMFVALPPRCRGAGAGLSLEKHYGAGTKA